MPKKEIKEKRSEILNKVVNMKIKFCDYIKTAKVGDIFFEPVDGWKYIIIGGNKKKTFTIEICRDKSETVEWSNEDKDKIIPTN